MGTKLKANEPILWALIFVMCVGLILAACSQSDQITDPATKAPAVVRPLVGERAALYGAPSDESEIVDLMDAGEEIIVVWEKCEGAWLFVVTPRFTAGYVLAENCQLQGPRQVFDFELGAR